MMKITVFTPTYNRGYIIETLYRSLQRQSFTDFEWLVIDDGSSDNTKELFEQWSKESNPFPIRYFYKENGGKHRAINDALDLAQAELFFVMDSDDYLTDDALEKIISWEQTIEEKSAYCGFMGQCGSSPTTTINRRLNARYRDGNALDRYPDYTSEPIDGERAEVWYTAVHRQFKYPEYEGERFMTEAVVWNRMAHAGYKIRYFDDIIWIFQYKNDGLTKAGFSLFARNPQGYILFQMEKTRFIHSGILPLFKCVYSLFCDLHTYYSKQELIRMMPDWKWLICLSAAYYRLKHK